MYRMINYGYGNYLGGPTQSSFSPSQNFSMPTSQPTFGQSSFGNQSVSPSANSYSVAPPLSNPVPDVSRADPNTLSRLQAGISNLVYDPSRSGYITQAEENSSAYTGQLQGGDPAANRAASNFYGYLGSLPTRPLGTPALNQLYSMTGQQPAAGPSLNSWLSNFYNNASPYVQNAFKQAGFGTTYQGPYRIGNGSY